MFTIDFIVGLNVEIQIPYKYDNNKHSFSHAKKNIVVFFPFFRICCVCLINVIFAESFWNREEYAVANNIIPDTHRIQRWDLRDCLVPDISDAQVWGTRHFSFSNHSILDCEPSSC